MAEENKDVVYAARRNGIVGFFSGRVPEEEGWVSDGRTVDLSRDMGASRCTLEEVLTRLNAHWLEKERSA